MKTNKKIEALLKTFFGIHHRRTTSREEFDKCVMKDAVEKLSSARPRHCKADQDPSVCVPCQSRWLKWAAAAVVLALIGLKIVEKNSQQPSSKQSPSKVVTVVSNDLPTLSKMSIILQNQGLDAVITEFDRLEHDSDPSESVTALKMIQTGLDFNDKH